MRRRTLTAGLLASTMLSTTRNLFAYEAPRNKVIYTIKIGRRQWPELSPEDIANGWRAVPWQDAKFADLKFEPFELERGRSSDEDRWLDAIELDYPNVDLAERRERYYDLWLRERGYTAQTLSIKLDLAFERAYAASLSSDPQDYEYANEDKEYLWKFQQDARAAANAAVMPSPPSSVVRSPKTVPFCDLHSGPAPLGDVQRLPDGRHGCAYCRKYI